MKKEEMEVIISQIEMETAKAYQDIQQYLKFYSRFTHYSMNNTMLILSQKPEATLVASYKKWQELGHQVKKGEKGIKILAPSTFKVKEEDKDGEEKEVEHLYFRAVHVFDVSQTEGDPLPEICKELDGELPDGVFGQIFFGLVEAINLPIEYREIKGTCKGWYSHDTKSIVLKEGMSQIQTLKTLIHEGAHAILHNEETGIPDLTREAREVQAEAVAFTVLERYGIDSSEYSFPYIAAWAEDKEIGTLRQYLDEITRAVKTMTTSIDKRYSVNK